jgi:CO/xanthine dehydrogenase Mo-binding subunit
VEKARKLPGIHAVLTYKDVEKLNPMLGWPRQKPLLDRRLRYIGDSVALIAGDTEEIVMEAMELIQVEYEVLDAVYDGLSARKDGAPQLYDSFPKNIVPGGYRPMQEYGDFWHLVRGDVEQGFAECTYIAEDTVSFSSMCAPSAPEPPGTIVRWEGDLNFTVWGTAQSSFILKLVNESVILGSKVKALTFNVGGSYGNKQSLTLEVIAGALLSMACNKPVKFFETKVEQMINHETRL